MLALTLTPKRSLLFLTLIVAVHSVLAGLVAWMLEPPLRYWFWAACGASLVWAWTQWRHSAAYFLHLHPDGKILLCWRGAAPISVLVAEGGYVSKWVLVSHWQDGQQQIYRTLVWRDSVDRRTFKLWYVWLRWQPQQHKAGSKWHK